MHTEMYSLVVTVESEIMFWLATRLRFFYNSEAHARPDQVIRFGDHKDAAAARVAILRHSRKNKWVLPGPIQVVTSPMNLESAKAIGAIFKAVLHSLPVQPGFVIARMTTKDNMLVPKEYLNISGEGWIRPHHMTPKRVRVFLTYTEAKREMNERKKLGFHTKDWGVLPSPLR